MLRNAERRRLQRFSTILAKLTGSAPQSTKTLRDQDFEAEALEARLSPVGRVARDRIESGERGISLLKKQTHRRETADCLPRGLALSPGFEANLRANECRRGWNGQFADTFFQLSSRLNVRFSAFVPFSTAKQWALSKFFGACVFPSQFLPQTRARARALSSSSVLITTIFVPLVATCSCRQRYSETSRSGCFEGIIREKQRQGAYGCKSKSPVLIPAPPRFVPDSLLTSLISCSFFLFYSSRLFIRAVPFSFGDNENSVEGKKKMKAAEIARLPPRRKLGGRCASCERQRQTTRFYARKICLMRLSILSDSLHRIKFSSRSNRHQIFKILIDNSSFNPS